MPDASLERVQRWMAAVLAGRGDLRQKLARAEVAHGLGIGEVLAARRGPSIERRLDVYAAGYVLRLVACLSEEFPALRAFWGEPLFETFARAYILDHPPDTRSLFDVGRELPRYLERTRPPLERVPSEQRDALGLPAQIARLERTASEVARAPGPEGRAHVSVPGPLELLSGAVRLEPAPCLRLLDLDYDLLEFCAALERGERPALPCPEPTHVAVTRARWQVSRSSLEGWQAQFLAWCQAQRRPVALCEWPGGDGDGVARVMLWLPAAIDGGLLQLSGVTASSSVGSRTRDPSC